MTVPDPATTIRAALMNPGMDAWEEEREPDADALAALGVLEARLADTERALREIRLSAALRLPGAVGSVWLLATCDAALAGSPAEEPTP